MLALNEDNCLASVPPNTLLRNTVVNALDDLGEREKLEGLDGRGRRAASPQRSRRLQWRLQRWRGAFTVLMLLVAITGTFGVVDWGHPGRSNSSLLKQFDGTYENAA